MRDHQGIATRTGTTGLLLYCLGIMSWEDVLVGGQWLMNVGMILILPGVYRSLAADRLFQLSLLFYLYLLVYAGVLLQQHAGPAGPLVEDFTAYFRMGFLQAVVVGFWWAALKAQGRVSWPIWALVAGYGCRLLLDWPNEDWSHGIPSKLGFGIYYTLFGAFSALVVAWMLVLLCRVTDAGRSLAGNFGLLVLAVISFLGLVYSSSRGAILGFLVALPFILYGWWKRARRGVAGWKPVATGTAVLLVLGLLIASGPVADRDPGGNSELSLFFEQGFADYTPKKVTAIGTRLVIWREAWHQWRDKPLFGNGPRSTAGLLDKIEREYVIDKVNNFHNTYLEILVRLGALGALFFLAHLVLSAASFRDGIRHGWYGWDVATYLLAGGAAVAVTLIFKEGTLDPRGGAVATFFLGGYYAYAAGRLLRNGVAPGDGGPTQQRRAVAVADARGNPE